ncbi:MAG TPA: PAS domain S-box protein [Pyrinomonadaceae bacterium]|nr:PAS domain S-box protein [Pyrinomonadaceae bacterium]
MNQSKNGRHDDSVLIVNDVPEQLSLMNSLLRKAGYSVLTAEDGLQAFDIARREHPDVVISDVTMPNLGGIEFCKLLRQDNDLRFIPILLVSALQKGTESVVAGLRAGADDYLEVPYDSARLVAKVSRLLERSRMDAGYRDLVEQATDLIFTQDNQGRLTSINAAGAEFLGRGQEDLIGVFFNEAFQIDSRTAAVLDGAKQLEQHEDFRHQFLTKHAKGGERWLEIVMFPIRDRLNETTVGLRGVARDITERKRFELALLDSEERYRLLFESIPQPIWVYDEETLRFLAVNQAATQAYGYSREEFLSMTVNDIRSPDEVPALLIKSATSVDEPVISSPWRHQRKDGSVIYVEMSTHHLLFKGRKAQLAIANDVTERKLLDEKQRDMHLSLQQSAIEWRQTFNAISFPVLIVNTEGFVSRLNRAAEEIAGSSAEKLVGRHMSEIDTGEPWEKATELIQAIRDDGGDNSAEVRDAVSRKTWQIGLYLIHEFGSVGERVILIAQDITKRTQLEASLRQSEKMSMLGSLVAGVAHEVRNPLFGISSILDAFETRFSERTDYLRYTNILRNEIGRLTSLMEELLEYGKPFKGELYLASINEVVTKSIRACLPAAEVAQVHVINSIRWKLPPLLIDRRRLSKVFVNLIENAVQHSSAGGSVTIEAHKVRDGDQQWLECAVTDSGSGIDERDLPLIFEPFFSRRRSGTGLGLAIAHRIMNEHGGRLIATNNPGGGARMIARFPLPTDQELLSA